VERGGTSGKGSEEEKETVGRRGEGKKKGKPRAGGAFWQIKIYDYTPGIHNKIRWYLLHNITA